MSSLNVPLWAWGVLAVVVAISITTDLVAHRGDHVDSKKRALAWTLLWVTVAMAFNLFVYLWFGSVPAQEFLAAYLLEKSLSVDNLFVFLLVFGALKIPQAEQRRVLTWGILGAIVFRGLLIFAGAAAVQRWHALTYVFGAILIFAAIKLVREKPEKDEDSKVVLWLEKHIRWTRKLHGHHFIVKLEDGKRYATPLLLALLAIEFTDIVFAIDSVPAAFAVTQEPFLIFSSNLLAILGLRALYIVLAGLLADLRYLKYGLSAVLAFAGAKLLAVNYIKLPPLISVAIIAVCITVSVVASVIANRRDARKPDTETDENLRIMHGDMHGPQVSNHGHA